MTSLNKLNYISILKELKLSLYGSSSLLSTILFLIGR